MTKRATQSAYFFPTIMVDYVATNDNTRVALNPGPVKDCACAPYNI